MPPHSIISASATTGNYHAHFFCVKSLFSRARSHKLPLSYNSGSPSANSFMCVDSRIRLFHKSTGDFKIQDVAHAVPLRIQCLRNPPECPIHGTGGGDIKLHFTTCQCSVPQGGAFLPPLKGKQGFLTHSAAETKQLRCPSFSSRTSLVRASPVDCRPMTMHCGDTRDGGHEGWHSEVSGQLHWHRLEAFPRPRYLPLAPVPGKSMLDP